MKRYLKNTMLFSILCTVVMACGDREDEVSSNTGNNGDKGERGACGVCCPYYSY
jgi:hypothetical protein